MTRGTAPVISMLWFGLVCEACAGCPGIGCEPSVTLQATIAWQGDREFGVDLCHVDACDEYVVREPQRGTECTRGASSALCLQRSTDRLAFDATWSADVTPGESSFRLRIEDRDNGDLLLDETREARVRLITTEPGDCARCDRVSVDLNRR